MSKYNDLILETIKNNLLFVYVQFLFAFPCHLRVATLLASSPSSPDRREGIFHYELAPRLAPN